MIVQAEGDVIGSNLNARQPANTSMIREWEMAGTSHADAYTTGWGSAPTGAGAGALTMFGYLRAPPIITAVPTGSTPDRTTGSCRRRSAGLDTWVRTLQDPNVADVAPPHGTPLPYVSSSPVVLARDAYGNALGGVRSPHVDAPVAALDSVNTRRTGRVRILFALRQDHSVISPRSRFGPVPDQSGLHDAVVARSTPGGERVSAAGRCRRAGGRCGYVGSSRTDRPIPLPSIASG